MSQQNPRTISAVADDDLSTYQYLLVKASANGKVDISGSDGEICVGILQNKPAADGEEARVAIGGTSKLKCKPGSSTQQLFGTEAKSNGAGYGIAAGSGTQVHGILLESTGTGTDANTIFTVEVLVVNYEKN